jgi:hypothetical protein
MVFPAPRFGEAVFRHAEFLPPVVFLPLPHPCAKNGSAVAARRPPGPVSTVPLRFHVARFADFLPVRRQRHARPFRRKGKAAVNAPLAGVFEPKNNGRDGPGATFLFSEVSP